jgi:hypothetical protein
MARRLFFPGEDEQPTEGSRLQYLRFPEPDNKQLGAGLSRNSQPSKTVEF